MSRYKPYPYLRSSSIEWLPELPSHWQASKTKHVAQVDNSGSYGSEMGEEPRTLPVATTAQISPDGLFDVESMPQRSFSKQEVERYSCTANDLLIVKSSGSSANIISGKIGRVTSETPTFVFSNFLLRIRPAPASVDARFLYSFLRSKFTRNRIERMCSATTYPNLNVSEYVSADIPLPPLAEQREIAIVLDRQTTRIDTLIAKKTRFIELLKEKRQALITHAVTKGLDPNVPMKDSGVEWVGQVPAHWEVRRIGTLYKEAVRAGEEHLPILSISIHDGITDKELGDDDRTRRVEKIEDRTKYQRVVPGDLAYNMMRAWQGGFGAVQVEGLVSPAYVVAKPYVDLLSGYIEKLLRTPMAIEEMRRFSKGIADFRQRLYWEHFRDLRVCLPPIGEQRRIMDFICVQSERMNKIEVATSRSIELLKERRAALITAAVTGKIDVRQTETEAA